MKIVLAVLFVLAIPIFVGLNEVYAAEAYNVTVSNCASVEKGDAKSGVIINGKELTGKDLYNKACTDENIKRLCGGLGIKKSNKANWGTCLEYGSELEPALSGDTVVMCIGAECESNDDAPDVGMDEVEFITDETTAAIEGGTDTSTTPDDNSSGGEKEEANCMNSGAAGTLGWIVCPMMDWLTGAVDAIYNTFLEPALQVKPQLFANNGSGNGGSTFSGWEVFRNLANGLMIVLLLGVIFSQVTGVGIDNYGIKKILPKIIVGAILMNLSYWICIVAVDLSNILGNGFQQLFVGITPQVTEVAGASVTSGLKSTAISVAVLVTLAGSAGAIWALSDGSIAGVLLLLLVGAITVLVSIITLFIILSARQAAIVVLVVISPLAMACYMLPNTKSLFDRWVKFMQNLLLVYPVAGLLVGGGNFVSGLLLGAGMGGDLFGAVTAMIAGIIPIFFIPTVLRRSLAMAGNIGNMISGVGRNVGRRAGGFADKGIRNTEAFKRNQERLANQRRVNSARRVNARMRNRSLSRPLTAREQDTMAQAQKVLTAQRARENENRNLSDTRFLRSERRKQDIQNENARRDVLLYDNAEMVTGNLNRAENQRRQQLVEARDWSDVAHVAAMENKQDTQHEIAEGELMLHLNPVIGQAEINKANQQIHQRLNEAGNWTDATYIQAQGIKSDTESAEERANTSMWATDPNKQTAVQMQGQTSRENQQLQNQNWANGVYVQGVRERQRLQSEDDLGKTTMYADASFVEGASKQQQMQRDESFDNTIRYAGADGDKLVQATRQRGDNTRLMEQETANAGVPILSQTIAEQRAQSSKQATEFKNYTEQYSIATRGDMNTALHDAITEYKNNRGDENNVVRLQAAIAAANSKGMNKELLNELSDVDFSANNSSDAKILNQMVGTNNTILSQYAKSRLKPGNAGTPKSLHSFVDDVSYAGATDDGDNLASVFKNKGDDILKGMDDDSLEYLKKEGGAKALSTKAMYQAASATTNTKELNHLHDMMAGRTDYKMSVNDLAKLKLSTINALGTNDSSYRAALNELKANRATSAAYQQIYASMDPAVKAKLGI